MSEPSSNLDALIAALEAAVAAGHTPSVSTHLAAIDDAMKDANPLARATTYAHVKAVTGDPLKAAEVLEDIGHLVDGDATLHYQIGCYRRLGKDGDGALAAFCRATDRDASHVDAWMARGTLLDDRGDPGAAIEAYRHVVLLAPAEPDAWRNLGNSLAALTFFDQAIEAYRTALSCAPDDEMIGFLLASAHQAKGDIDQANALLPAGMRTRLGRITEVTTVRAGLALACRFHQAEAHHEPTAQDVLASLELEAPPSEPTAIEVRDREAYLVPFGPVVLLCDPDPVRTGLPNRFFDATQLVTG